ARVPSRKRAVLSNPEEQCLLTGREQEIRRTAVEHQAGGRACTRLIGWRRNVDHQRREHYRHGCSIYQRGGSARVIGEPPRRGGTMHESPCIPYVCVLHHRWGGGV